MNHCNAPRDFALDSRGGLWRNEVTAQQVEVCAPGWTVACWKGMVRVQATCEAWFCTVTLVKTILYSWQSYKVMPLVMTEN